MSDTLDPKSPSMKLWRTLITRGVDTDEATELMNGYAHELAERQRTYAREVGIPLEDGDTVSAGDVIDLIDPLGVDPVRPDEETT